MKLKKRCLPALGAIILLAAVVSVHADLPSCARAKCTHCRVQFIAEMCPGACAVCPSPTASKHLITTAQQPGVHDARAFGAQQTPARVPLAQQPLEAGGVPRFAPQQQQQQQGFNEFRPNNFNNNGQSMVYPGQYPPQGIPQQQVQTVQQQQQFPTQFGGFYNGPPPPQVPEGPVVGGGFNNPFQPFMHQTFNSAQQPQQQFQPPPFPAMQPFTMAPPPLQGPTWFDFSPLTVPTVPPPQSIPYPQQQQPYNNIGGQQQQQPQMYGNNNNNNFGTVGQQAVTATQPQPQQQQFNKPPLLQPQQQFMPPQQPPSGPAAVLHAVPSVSDPLQRPRQLYSLPMGNEQIGDKQLQHIDGPGNYILDKAAGEEFGVKKPYNSVTSIFQAENGRTCPKQPNWEPCVPKEIANQRFRNCCAGLGDGCSQLCSYDQNLNAIQVAVLTGRCPITKVADMMVCASGNEDATACCQAFGVFEPGFEHCRPYCNPAAGLPNDGMLAEKYRCLQKLQQIQKCFYLTQRP